MPITYMPRKDGSKVLIWGNLTPMELRAHNSWVAMRNRTNRRDEAFPDKKYYCDKNVRVCDRWQNSFEAFLEDMGTPPTDKHSLDRKAGSTTYDKESCRWATDKEQAINRTSTVFVPIGGRVETLSDWERISGIKAETIRKRMLTGRPESEWLSPEPLPHRFGHKITINGVTKNAAGWAIVAGVSAPCILYRLKIGLTGEALLSPPEPKMRIVRGGRPPGSKNKPAQNPSDILPGI